VVLALVLPFGERALWFMASLPHPFSMAAPGSSHAPHESGPAQPTGPNPRGSSSYSSSVRSYFVDRPDSEGRADPSFFGEVADAGIVDHVVVRDGPQGVVGGAFTSEAEAVTLSLAAAGCTGLAPQSAAAYTRRWPVSVAAGFNFTTRSLSLTD